MNRTENQPLQVILSALDVELEYAWLHEFKSFPNIHVHPGNILRHQADAIVSPANSFGFMDGGIDLVYSQYFGWEVEGRVREAILSKHHGELPVGNALIVPTDDSNIPHLICAPTMRVPMNVADTFNAYLAFRACLFAIQEHNRAASNPISSVLVPGLGTGEGRMPATACARQMRMAYDNVINGQKVTMGGLAGAVRNHLKLMGLPGPGS
jgi:O-acetyl-ADP-ribose deacetylase (regulator of RNase III)